MLLWWLIIIYKGSYFVNGLLLLVVCSVGRSLLSSPSRGFGFASWRRFDNSRIRRLMLSTLRLIPMHLFESTSVRFDTVSIAFN